ncbi:MAG: lysophospholipase L1-like esterase [Myxococcota bacterium]|jgi:lysophospholipase L1-like esterase
MPRRLIFSLVPVVVLFSLAEIGLRMSGYPPEATAPFEHKEPFWIVDADQRQEPTPHKELGVSFPVTTNRDGLRAPLVEIDNPADDWRIMTMGCSTTYGWGVTDAESYPARLGALITDSGQDGVQVINAGQPGYTSFQGQWLWDEVLADYKPDIVLIGFVVQDARKAAYSDKSQALHQKDARFLKDNVLYKWRTYLWLFEKLGEVQLEAKERGQGDEGGTHRVPLSEYGDNLQALIAEVKAVGGTPVLFGYPLERTGYTEQHRYYLQATAEHAGVLYFDPQPKMEQASNTAELYFPRDRGHANAAGNALIAEWVFEFLRDNALLSEDG